MCFRLRFAGSRPAVGKPAARFKPSDLAAAQAGMAQRVGAFERQSVHCEFVGGFGTESVDVGGQTVEAVVFEGFVTAVGIIGTDVVARCVVVVAGGMAQRIGNGFEIAVFGVTKTGDFAGTVGKADELVEGVIV